jgi:hypothetical protein
LQASKEGIEDGGEDIDGDVLGDIVVVGLIDGADERDGVIDGADENDGVVDGADENVGVIDGADENDGVVDGADENVGLTVGEGDSVMTVGDIDGALLNPKIVGLFVTLFSLGPLLCRSSSAKRYRSLSES